MREASLNFDVLGKCASTGVWLCVDECEHQRYDLCYSVRIYMSGALSACLSVYMYMCLKVCDLSACPLLPSLSPFLSLSLIDCTYILCWPFKVLTRSFIIHAIIKHATQSLNVENEALSSTGIPDVTCDAKHSLPWTHLGTTCEPNYRQVFSVQCEVKLDLKLLLRRNVTR